MGRPAVPVARLGPVTGDRVYLDSASGEALHPAAREAFGAAILFTASAAVAIWTIYGDTLGPLASLALTSPRRTTASVARLMPASMNGITQRSSRRSHSSCS